jgi:hypothetical protein
MTSFNRSDKMAVADVAAVNGGGAATAALGAMAALGATAALGASAVVGDDFNNISMGGGGGNAEGDSIYYGIH